ncbi:trypsin-like serine protease [candidate division KSB1 bacterium]|nr:trypsin-like serine protease [candidate division KSB1 bacterium]
MMRRMLSFAFILLFLCGLNYSLGQQNIISNIVEKYGKAVVMIASVNPEQETYSLGSGFIVDSEGIIITNYHVIEGAYPIIIKLLNGDFYDNISVINADERRDLAILKIDGWDLPTVELGNSNDAKIGEEVIVIGNPQGLQNTVANGIISAFRQSEGGFQYHQITAPVSKGSSGSPVFNNAGEVIGVISASIEDGQNLNFCIPINYARAQIRRGPAIELSEFYSQSKNNQIGSLKPVKNADIKSFLSDLHEIVEKIYTSYDSFRMGVYETKQPHYIQFRPNQFAISSSIYYARESLQIALTRIKNISPPNQELANLLKEYYNIAKELDKGINTVLSGLEERLRTGGYPNWSNVTKGEVKIIAQVNELIPLNSRFFEEIQSHNSELEDEILPIIRLSPFWDEYVGKNEPRISTGLYVGYSTFDVKIIYIDKNSPADLGTFKVGEQIIGASENQKFESIIDYFQYLSSREFGENFDLYLFGNGEFYTKTVYIEGRRSYESPPFPATSKQLEKEVTYTGKVTGKNPRDETITVEIDNQEIVLQKMTPFDELPNINERITLWIKDKRTCVIYFKRKGKTVRTELYSVTDLQDLGY